MRVPLVDLRASYLPIREALLAEFDDEQIDHVADRVRRFFAGAAAGGERP